MSTTDFAGFTYGTKAFLACAECGLEREIAAEGAKPLIESAISRSAIAETLSHDALEGDWLGHDRPAGTEWLTPKAERGVAA